MRLLFPALRASALLGTIALVYIANNTDLLSSKNVPSEIHTAVTALKSTGAHTVTSLKLMFSGPQACAKYEEKGEMAMRGCAACEESFPANVDDCMECGSVCLRKTCDHGEHGHHHHGFDHDEHHDHEHDEHHHHHHHHDHDEHHHHDGYDHEEHHHHHHDHDEHHHHDGYDHEEHHHHHHHDRAMSECLKDEPFKQCHSTCLAMRMKTQKPDDAEKTEEVDCYFDKECHKLVDWEKVGVLKMHVFERLKMMKSEDETKPLAAGVHARLVSFGVPENRADFIVNKWIKYHFKDYKPEQQNPDDTPKTSAGDCYFDKECHKLVDWEKVGVLKMHVFERLKMMKSVDETKPLAAGVHARLVRCGVPENRADFIVTKWIKSVFKDYEPSPPEPSLHLDGIYFSFKTGGNPTEVVDRYEARTRGDLLTHYRNGPVGSGARVDTTTATPMESYTIKGNKLIGSVQATVEDNGDIVWSHGYTSRKESRSEPVALESSRAPATATTTASTTASTTLTTTATATATTKMQKMQKMQKVMGLTNDIAARASKLLDDSVAHYTIA